MPKTSVKVPFNKFVKGLITEASPLNFPEDASFDEENFELNRDGSRQRRRGIAAEPFFTEIVTSLTDAQFTSALPVSFTWTAVSGIPNKNFLVVQIGALLYFFDMEADTLSTDGLIGTLLLVDYPVGVRYSFTSVDGYLIVAAGVDTVALVTYDDPGFSASYERLTVRDVWGIAT